jgi:tetratricopeptide (TPR) repeat protein
MWQGVGVELPDPGSIRGIDRRNDLIERFAENAHVQFALAVSDEQRVLDWLSTAGVEVARQQSLNRKLAVDTARAAMAELAGRYAHLSGDPVIGPEATLRAGVMHLFGERYDDSLTWLARVPQGDPWLDYLSSLFVGRALTELERYDEAAAALRAAIAVRPGAQSARTILVTALFLAGHPEEAASEARRSLTAADELDPWVWYPFGAYRHLDERLISMRELLR